MLISRDQIRGARALLRLDQDGLAGRAGVSVVTIRRVEAAQDAARVAPATLAHFTPTCSPSAWQAPSSSAFNKTR